MSFADQIRELIRDNGWGDQLIVEEYGGTVRVSLGPGHRLAPGDVVNDYLEGQNPLEQVQQECLRALRTGRPGA